jgi:hypothetical protein
MTAQPDSSGRLHCGTRGMARLMTFQLQRPTRSTRLMLWSRSSLTATPPNLSHSRDPRFPCTTLGARWERRGAAGAGRLGDRTPETVCELREWLTPAASFARVLSSHRGGQGFRSPQLHVNPQVSALTYGCRWPAQPVPAWARSGHA